MPVSGSQISFEIDQKEMMRLKKNMRKLEDRARRRVARKAMSAALTPLNKTVKKNIPQRYHGVKPEDLKYLKRSIGKKVKVMRYSGCVWGGVGPRKKFDDARPSGIRSPSKLIIMLERGTPNVRAAAILRRSEAEARNQVQAAMAAKFNEAIEVELAKL